MQDRLQGCVSALPVNLANGGRDEAAFICTGALWSQGFGGDHPLASAPGAAGGLMSGQAFPEELPPAYSERYGPGRLHDTEFPAPFVPGPVDQGDQGLPEAWLVVATHGYAQKSIAALKAQTQDVWRWE